MASYKVVLWQNIKGKHEVTVTALPTGLLLTKGDFSTPITNIKYIEKVS